MVKYLTWIIEMMTPVNVAETPGAETHHGWSEKNRAGHKISWFLIVCKRNSGVERQPQGGMAGNKAEATSATGCVHCYSEYAYFLHPIASNVLVLNFAFFLPFLFAFQLV